MYKKTTGCAGGSKKLSLCPIPPQRKASLVQREVAKIGFLEPIFDGGIVILVTIPQSACSADRADCQASATLSAKTSAGVFQPRHFLGRLLIRSSTA